MSLPTEIPVNSDSSDKFQASFIESWKRALVERINPYDGSNDNFIKTFVPSRARCNFRGHNIKNAFADWTPKAGQEVESYDVLLNGLDTLVKPFPEDKRLSFFRSHSHEMKFPFAAFESNHHTSNPNLAALLPGVVSPPDAANPTWADFSMIMEAKASAADDPFTSSSLESCEEVFRLAVSARSLMHAHGLLATFALGIYGDIARIARFDHACAVVSKPFSLKKLEDLKLLQRFFWRFVNPCHIVPFIGCDPTVRKLNSDDEEWLKEHLIMINFPGVDELVLHEARRAEVYDADDDEPKAYIMFKALNVNGCLFSRATTVWLGIRDNRSARENDDASMDDSDVTMDDDETEDDVSQAGTEKAVVRIIKDAWRPLLRCPETDFYDLLDASISPEERVGLPTVLAGGDLGEREVRQWEKALYGQPTPSNEVDHQSRLSAQRTADLDDALASAPQSMLVLGQSTSTALPPHRPMQQTFSWRLTRGDDQWHQERSHMRFVVDTVGRSLTHFHSTRELVEAMLDAIRGHKLATEKAGVLHRDISVGNVLIVDKPEEGPQSRGFIHDFDYSSYAEGVEDDFPTNPPNNSTDIDYEQIANAPDSGDDDDAQANVKDRIGTYYFIAVQLLRRAGEAHKIHHDLESFYWALLWVILRHTEHMHPLKHLASADIFKCCDDRLAAGQKIGWLGDSYVLGIKGNPPLTALLDKYRRLVARSLFRKEENKLTYESVEKLFIAALDDNRWPENDASKTFMMSDLRTNTSTVQGQPLRKPLAASVPSKKKKAGPQPAVRSRVKRRCKAIEGAPSRPAKRHRRTAAL
ncbi:hypothetical protein L226DRAFT_563188 [Lentinus tigrinus ALCF2SS1-7]|uniref:Protein kinase domain-containing protein n=1 Tax=Lentinus tigrinus ALCF2SS1-6 TaxID=1328759 RepID=A0A5C2RUJ0_9APHY|nr:hypothetical protein L227DRAFT_615655 [Lentinus tigrinus ALCF2SS1-6]RPD69686.1 hypothetical protein L226DRAFT_563188 [Lentinus tigrinus ALCF2SS1-7]